MAAKNDITGDSLTTKSATDSYRNGWDRIFGKKKKEDVPKETFGKLTEEQKQQIAGLCEHIKKGDENE